MKRDIEEQNDMRKFEMRDPTHLGKKLELLSRLKGMAETDQERADLQKEIANLR